MLYTNEVNNQETKMNGWANYETWNVALWIGNNEFLYNTAVSCVEYCSYNETPWEKFQRCMMQGQIGSFLGKTGDGVKWNDEKIDGSAINEMMKDL
jgi:hypothetical protein